MRAEALIQLNDGRIAEAISLINEVRNRAKQSTAMIADYEMEYGVRFNIQPYTGSYSQADALKLLKFERRVELALESERFFDLISSMPRKLPTAPSTRMPRSLRIKMNICLSRLHR